MPPESALLSTLNPAQKKAVTVVQGPVLVIAGPGSGKTRVLTHRVAYLIQECGISAAAIMAVTFTNKAARVMKERLEELVGNRAQYLTIGTFHAICARLLRREAPRWGMPRSFVIFDADDQLTVIKQALKDLKLDDKMYPPRTIQHTISRAKDELLRPEDYVPPTYWHEVAGRVYKRYQEILQANDALDFDDLLMTTACMLRDYSDIREAYQNRYQHILVDEFQDTNTAQYQLVKLLTGKQRNLFVVGDPDQSIYSWRGANIGNIRSFTRDFSQAQTVLLEQNYRSTQTILDAAHGVISRNPDRVDKKLSACRTERLPLVIYEAYDEQDEAEFVVREIQRLVSQKIGRKGDCAVMYRTNAQSRVLEDAFVRHNMPYKLIGATRFYERREIKDVLAYLRLIHNPFDNISLLRIINVPARRLGSKTVAALEDWATLKQIPVYAALQLLKESDADTPFSTTVRKALLEFLQLLDDLLAAKKDHDLIQLLDLVLERTGYAAHVRDRTEEGEERWANIMELRSLAQEYLSSGAPSEGEDARPLSADDSLSALLEEVALVSDQDEIKEGADAVTLLTLHTAKGLEFGTVFMVGMEEGILPHSRSKEEAEGMEEERRLCYVGITRAKERLYLVHTFRRTLYGAQSVSEPSRFLRDIPETLVQGRAKAAPEASRAEKRTLPLGRAIVMPAPGRSVERKNLPRPAAQLEPARPKLRQVAFVAGDQVKHAQFGDGVVINSEIAGDDELVTVAFIGRGIKRLAASFAGLVKK